jgi:hypothetical protein
MELEEMKNIWDEMDSNPIKQSGFGLHNISNMSQLKFNENAANFKVGEIMGLFLAYTLAGIIIVNFNLFDDWYLTICGIFLIIYFMVMPLYTIVGIIKMNKIDFAKSSYKEVMEHFYFVKIRLKRAEKISFVASPFLFVSALAIITKLFIDKDLFNMSFQLPLVLLLIFSFFGAIIFNVLVFQKRDKTFQSVEELLKEGN